METHDPRDGTLGSLQRFDLRMGLPASPQEAETYFSRLYAVHHVDDEADFGDDS
jgi:hypothetical protein